jgi:hypothetical protein
MAQQLLPVRPPPVQRLLAAWRGPLVAWRQPLAA